VVVGGVSCGSSVGVACPFDVRSSAALSRAVRPTSQSLHASLIAA